MLAALDGESTARVLPLTMLSRYGNRPSSIGSTVIVSSTSFTMSIDISRFNTRLEGIRWKEYWCRYTEWEEFTMGGCVHS